MDLRLEVCCPCVRLRDHGHLEIRDAEFCDMALLLVVGGIRFDLLRNPPMGHRADIGFQEEVLLLHASWAASVLQDEIGIGPEGKPHAIRFHTIPEFWMIVLPIGERDGAAAGTLEERRMDTRHEKHMRHIEVLPFRFAAAVMCKLLGSVARFDERLYAIGAEHIHTFMRARSEPSENMPVAELW